MTSHRNKKILYYAGLVVALAACVAVGWSARNSRLFMARSSASSGTTDQVRLDSRNYRYVNPLLFSESAEDTSSSYRAMNSAINSYISNIEAANNVDSVSVYFRDLNTGNWTGVNENDTYEPSSMLKVVIMMAAYKIAEDDPTILTKKLYYEGPDVQTYQNYPPPDSTAPGYYSVKDLIDMMILDSDNGAVKSLFADPDIADAVASTYQLFRLPTPPSATSTSQGDVDFMSAKSYSVLFRTLYNSAFFSWNVSDQILYLLTETTFTQGLVAGVPSGISVAHKFGENTTLDSSGAVIGHELHDCGIVYYPNHPYLICVMTKGADFTKLQGVISGISQLVYQQIGTLQN